jgi:hypothetical protein
VSDWTIEASYPGSIEAWRIWRIQDLALTGRPAQTFLAAVGKRGSLWRHRERATAECRTYSSGHAAPSPDCTCGIWGMKTREDAIDALGVYVVNRRHLPHYAIGRVHLWGVIVECERGYRAQYAYPAELCVAPERIAALQAAYGVPVHAISGETFSAVRAARERRRGIDRDALTPLA